MKTGAMEYLVSFETDGENRRREFARKNGHSITDIITKVRKEYPNACMFRVLQKVEPPHLMG